MKLQIVEYRALNVLEGRINYRYILELDGRTVAWTGSTPEKYSSERVYDKLTRYLSNNCREYNIDNYPRFNRILGVEQDVVFEKEVSDAFLKELHIKQRIQAIEGDFK